LGSNKSQGMDKDFEKIVEEYKKALEKYENGSLKKNG
jgi:hypothetical protein